MRLDSEGKVAIVSGAARGLGRAICRQLAQDGFRVYGIDTLEAELRKTCAEFKKAGLTVHPIVLDVSNEKQVNAIRKAVGNDYDNIRCLVNNAGISARDENGKKIPTLALDVSVWERTLSVNVTGAFLLSKACLPPMIKNQWGRIINISSLRGRTAISTTTIAYPTSKAALLGFTRALAREVGSHGVTVNAICPGKIETAMTHASASDNDQNFMRSSLLGATGMPQDIANMVGYLASEKSNFITGATFDVNGGAWMG